MRYGSTEVARVYEPTDVLNTIQAALELAGFHFEEDYSPVYNVPSSGSWEMVGLVFYHQRALDAALAAMGPLKLYDEFGVPVVEAQSQGYGVVGGVLNRADRVKMKQSPEQRIVESVRSVFARKHCDAGTMQGFERTHRLRTVGRLVESLRTARQKYGDLADQLKQYDPSKTYKYIDFLCKVFPDGVQSDVQGGTVATVLQQFDDLVVKGLIKNADINSYDSWEQLSGVIDSASTTSTGGDKKRQAKAGADVVLDSTGPDGTRLLIVAPTTEEAAVVYGKGTKWCTSAVDSDNYFNDYYFNNLVTLYYAFLIPFDGNEEKYAFAVYSDGNVEAYNASDVAIPWGTLAERLATLAGLGEGEVRDLLVSRNIKERIKAKFTASGTQNEEGTWDFDGDVVISAFGLTELPIRFGRVSGDFYCSYNELTSLDGAPESVGGDFYCSGNQLTSLDGAPESVGGNFYCFSNQLTSLDGAPESVGGNFDCSYNPDLPSEEIEHYKASGAVRGRFYESRKHFRHAVKRSKATTRGKCALPAEHPQVTDGKDHFPINDLDQARNALSRAAQEDEHDWFDGTRTELEVLVRQVVELEYPSLKKKDEVVVMRLSSEQQIIKSVRSVLTEVLKGEAYDCSVCGTLVQPGYLRSDLAAEKAEMCPYCYKMTDLHRRWGSGEISDQQFAVAADELDQKHYRTWRDEGLFGPEARTLEDKPGENAKPWPGAVDKLASVKFARGSPIWLYVPQYTVDLAEPGPGRNRTALATFSNPDGTNRPLVLVAHPIAADTYHPPLIMSDLEGEQGSEAPEGAWLVRVDHETLGNLYRKLFGTWATAKDAIEKIIGRDLLDSEVWDTRTPEGTATLTRQNPTRKHVKPGVRSTPVAGQSWLDRMRSPIGASKDRHSRRFGAIRPRSGRQVV